jgi:hypothetical protein
MDAVVVHFVPEGNIITHLYNAFRSFLNEQRTHMFVFEIHARPLPSDPLVCMILPFFYH